MQTERGIERRLALHGEQSAVEQREHLARLVVEYVIGDAIDRRQRRAIYLAERGKVAHLVGTEGRAIAVAQRIDEKRAARSTAVACRAQWIERGIGRLALFEKRAQRFRT